MTPGPDPAAPPAGIPGDAPVSWAAGQDWTAPKGARTGPTAKQPASDGRRQNVRRVAAVVVSGVGLYLVLPSLVRVLGSWPRLSSLTPAWLAAGLFCEIGSFVCAIDLQRTILRTPAWFGVATAALTGNAVTNVLPGGDAAGAAVQFDMLKRAGVDADTAAGGMTTASLLGLGGLLVLPVFTLPAVLGGLRLQPGLLRVALLGAGAFVLYVAGGALVLGTDGPLRVAGRVAQWVANHRPGHHGVVSGWDARLLTGRDQVRTTLGRQWRAAVLLTAGRISLDFLCLLAAVRSTGSDANPFAVLIAYAAAGIIGLLPFTPGGLGIVEASLSGLLVLVGVKPGGAVLATLAYRLAQYWMPTLAGAVAYALFRHRYGRTSGRPLGGPPGPGTAAA